MYSSPESAGEEFVFYSCRLRGRMDNIHCCPADSGKEYKLFSLRLRGRMDFGEILIDFVVNLLWRKTKSKNKPYLVGMSVFQ